MYEITEKQQLSHSVALFRIRAPRIAMKRKAGQFIMLRLNEHGERIPLTIVDSDAQDGTITIISQEVGKTTEMLGSLNAGDMILDVVGPLGRATHIETFGSVVCIGGGIGTGPVYPIARELRSHGNRLISIIGARTRDLLILEKEMEAISDAFYVATDDGSFGHHGFVTQVLQRLIEEGTEIQRVFAIGPLSMMRAVSNLTRPYRLPTVVSVNPIMVDGTGMCGACRLTVGGKIMFACVDGPEFDGHEVDFEELIRRNHTYVTEEKIAMEEFTYHEGPRCYEGNT